MVDPEPAQAPEILALAAESPSLPIRCVHPRLFEARTDPRYIQQMAVLTALPGRDAIAVALQRRLGAEDFRLLSV